MKGFPPSVVVRLGGFDPDAIAERFGWSDVDQVPIRPAPRWLVKAWRGDVGAMTMPWAIYVRPDVLGGDPIRLGGLLTHELVHVRQFQELGPYRFLQRYLAEYWKGRRAGLGHDAAYRAISFELQAREESGW